MQMRSRYLTRKRVSRTLRELSGIVDSIRLQYFFIAGVKSLNVNA